MLGILKKIFSSKKPHSEWMVLEFLKGNLPNNPIIIEAGAHEGLDTRRMASIWPNCILYAFEPVPSVFSLLKNNVKLLENVHVLNLALSDTSIQSKMYVSTGRSNGSSSLLKPKEHLNFHPDVFFNEEIIVQTITLHDFAKENLLEKIDFMWFDLQGMEYKVLSESKLFLKNIGYIFCEVSLMETYEGVMKYPEFKSWMLEQGFQVIDEYLNWKDMGNVLFRNKNYIV